MDKYKVEDYVIGWDNIVVKLEKQITNIFEQPAFVTDFTLGGINQNITEESIQRLCTKEEINEHKKKHER